MCGWGGCRVESSVYLYACFVDHYVSEPQPVLVSSSDSLTPHPPHTLCVCESGVPNYNFSERGFSSVCFNLGRVSKLNVHVGICGKERPRVRGPPLQLDQALVTNQGRQELLRTHRRQLNKHIHKSVSKYAIINCLFARLFVPPASNTLPCTSSYVLVLESPHSTNRQGGTQCGEVGREGGGGEGEGEGKGGGSGNKNVRAQKRGKARTADIKVIFFTRCVLILIDESMMADGGDGGVLMFLC